MHLGNIYDKLSTEKIKPRQLYKNGQFHVMRLEIEKDELLKPHHAATDAFLVVVEGEINFNIKDENIYLHKGDMLSFEKHVTHSVQAVEDSILLIIK